MNKIIITNSNAEWVNASGTSERSPRCKCGTWKHHWENFSNEEWPDECSVKGCKRKAVLGAHIHKTGERTEYIAPFCDSHNKIDELFALKIATVIVNANKSETCG